MNDIGNTRPIEVLLVEDDPGDVDLTREILGKKKVLVNLTVAENGVKAMAYLHKQGEYADAVKPDLVLLDLNLPLKDGREVLHEIKSDAALKEIPVVILTTSDADEDIARTYAAGASCYITKPIGLEQFSKVVESIEGFWLSIVKFPQKE